MSELKPLPCPFCGGEAETLRGTCEISIVRCPGCDIRVYRRSKQEAVSAWNRRAEPANEPLTLDELREMLERLEEECQQASDGHEDYTNGYRWGHRNGQMELLRRILKVGDGACETDRRKPEPEGGAR